MEEKSASPISAGVCWFQPCALCVCGYPAAYLSFRGLQLRESCYPFAVLFSNTYKTITGEVVRLL